MSYPGIVGVLCEIDRDPTIRESQVYYIQQNFNTLSCVL
jgi:hypothetical protein